MLSNFCYGCKFRLRVFFSIVNALQDFIEFGNFIDNGLKVLLSFFWIFQTFIINLSIVFSSSFNEWIYNSDKILTSQGFYQIFLRPLKSHYDSDIMVRQVKHHILEKILERIES